MPGSFLRHGWPRRPVEVETHTKTKRTVAHGVPAGGDFIAVCFRLDQGFS